MVEVFLSTLLVSIAALIGVLITYFTRSELRGLKKHINMARMIILAALIFVVAFFGFYGTISLVGLFIGLILIYAMRGNKSRCCDWIWLGVVLGSSFAVGKEVGMIVASVLAIYVLIYAGYVNMPAVLKRTSESKKRVYEQSVFIASSLISYFVFSFLGAEVASIAVYVSVIALAGIYVRDSYLFK